jgi:hypothetical protein
MVQHPKVFTEQSFFFGSGLLSNPTAELFHWAHNFRETADSPIVDP